MNRDRWKLHLAVAAVAIAAMTMALTPAVADPVPDTEEYPDVAFLARNDVPFDAQTAASMAAQLGAPMFITNPGALSDAAANGISDLNPDVIIVAGGEFAISEDVANAAAAECDPDCTVDRRFGAGRDQTAAALAEIAADYGFDRPVLQGSNHVTGDVHVGGTVSANALTVEDTGLVSGLNADQLDGRDDYFHPDNDGSGSGLDADTLDGIDSSELQDKTERTILTYDGVTTNTSVGTFEKMRDIGDFTKVHDDTTLRLRLTSHGTTSTAGSTFCNFQLRVNDLNANGGTGLAGFETVVNSEIRTPLTNEPYFDGLPSGTHTVSLWVRGVSSPDCTDNPGNYDRVVVVEEVPVG